METDYPSLIVCKACKEGYSFSTFHSRDVTHRNKTSTRPESENIKEKCFICSAGIPNERLLERENAEVSRDNICKSKLLYLIIGIIALVSIPCLWSQICHGCFSDARSKVSGEILNTELANLKLKYPNQNPELWHNVLKITNYTEPSVQVLILLHKGNNEVAECFARDLVKIINQIINKDGLAIYKENSKVTEYGEELSHYLNVVREHNHLIVYQLNKIPGNTARMFHFLCEETGTPIRPSFFIFTVEDGTEESSQVARPSLRASRTLRSAWSNLMENELHPLIARVVRNVAEILPENITC